VLINRENGSLIPKYETVQVTKRLDTKGNEWMEWNWRSEKDLLVNGAFFTPSGEGASGDSQTLSLPAKPASMVDAITASAGALSCRRGKPCY